MIENDVDLRLDGNAAAGPLSDVFWTEMTTALVVCAGCGAMAPAAELMDDGHATAPSFAAPGATPPSFASPAPATATGSTCAAFACYASGRCRKRWRSRSHSRSGGAHVRARTSLAGRTVPPRATPPSPSTCSAGASRPRNTPDRRARRRIKRPSGAPAMPGQRGLAAAPPTRPTAFRRSPRHTKRPRRQAGPYRRRSRRIARRAGQTDAVGPQPSRRRRRPSLPGARLGAGPIAADPTLPRSRPAQS